jgi:hypothetical protein
MWMSVQSIFFGACRHLPFLAIIGSYKSEKQLESLVKFLVLWVLSILPLLFAAMIPIFSSGELEVLPILHALNTEFSSTSVLVYSVSYLVPFMYTAVELSIRHRQYAFERKVAPSKFDFPKGYPVLLCISGLIFLFAIFVYKRVDSQSPEISYLSGKVKWIVYFYSVACWYTTLLIDGGVNSSDGSPFRDSLRQSESKATKDLTERLNGEDQE